MLARLLGPDGAVERDRYVLERPGELGTEHGWRRRQHAQCVRRGETAAVAPVQNRQ